jgi:hypothetical protein
MFQNSIIKIYANAMQLYTIIILNIINLNHLLLDRLKRSKDVDQLFFRYYLLDLIVDINNIACVLK